MNQSEPGATQSRKPLAVRFVGDQNLGRALAELGVEEGGSSDPLVFAPRPPLPTWAAVEEVFLAAFRLSREAMEAGAPIVYVIAGAGLYGHTETEAAILATGLLGGVRSIAVEGARDGVKAHAVTASALTDPDRVAAAVLSLLDAGVQSGQVIHCDDAHVARPAV